MIGLFFFLLACGTSRLLCGAQYFFSFKFLSSGLGQYVSNDQKILAAVQIELGTTGSKGLHTGHLATASLKAARPILLTLPSICYVLGPAFSVPFPWIVCRDE